MARYTYAELRQHIATFLIMMGWEREEAREMAADMIVPAVAKKPELR